MSLHVVDASVTCAVWCASGLLLLRGAPGAARMPRRLTVLPVGTLNQGMRAAASRSLGLQGAEHCTLSVQTQSGARRLRQPVPTSGATIASRSRRLLVHRSWICASASRATITLTARRAPRTARSRRCQTRRRRGDRPRRSSIVLCVALSVAHCVDAHR